MVSAPIAAVALSDFRIQGTHTRNQAEGYITPSLVIKIDLSEVTLYPNGDLTTDQLDFADALMDATRNWRDALHGLAGLRQGRPSE